MTTVSIDQKKEVLFRWIYMPFEIKFDDSQENNDKLIQTVEYIKSLSNFYSIPGHVIFFKVVEFFVRQKMTQDQIENSLFKLKMITFKELKDIVEIVRNIKDNFKDKPKKDITDQLSLINKWKPTGIHQGYPIPDPIKGRPRLEWKYCAHYGCGQKFDGTSDPYPAFDYSGLKQHLKEVGNYRDWFHHNHERMIDKLNLTPEKVLAEKITKCPSHLCDIKEFSSPQELCHHFMILGIPPFWKQGMIIEPQFKSGKLENVTQQIYIEKECIICCEPGTTPGILFLPCNHCVICIDCFSTINKCPMCQSVIMNYLFF